MDRLPSNIMLSIFSRVPAICLARFRCVSKEWCEYIDDPYLTILQDEQVLEPIPILYHSRLSLDRRIHNLCFHTIESSKQTESGITYDDYHTYVLEPKEGRFLKFLRKKPLSEPSRVGIRVRGSCNGLICLSHDEDYDLITSLVVVHLLRKECYELPPLPMCFGSSMRRGSCGLGFDASTNTLKMVCVLCRDFGPECTVMVHEFGTNSWREIPQVPSYPITGEAIFANGCLHWLVSHVAKDGGIGVIWFDVNKEEFGLIDPPKGVFYICSIHSCVFFLRKG
ncbi:F-box domain-containing protein [Artemisia annua]|uniref:F-box domain-containing protein n=1 Tax=Artemisia annua TaxID=35608 RepID=A0A2U1KMA3_ARTAN|nr:F-box domain-containing protein [Artemisia annua]